MTSQGCCGKQIMLVERLALFLANSTQGYQPFLPKGNSHSFTGGGKVSRASGGPASEEPLSPSKARSQCSSAWEPASPFSGCLQRVGQARPVPFGLSVLSGPGLVLGTPPPCGGDWQLINEMKTTETYQHRGMSSQFTLTVILTPRTHCLGLENNSVHSRPAGRGGLSLGPTVRCAQSQRQGPGAGRALTGPPQTRWTRRRAS